MIKKTITRVAGLSLKAKIILSVVVLVVLGLIGFWISKSHSSSAATATRSKRGLAEQVSIASVSSLTPNSAALSVIGQVSSENQATILSQVAGEIVHVNRQLGDSVSAGDVIATMDDSSQQAAVDQAQGSYDAALAALAQASGTTANNSTITSNQAALNVQNAQLSVEASLKSLYTAMDDAVTTKSDTLFRYHNSQLAGLNQILQYPNDTDLQQTVENERPLLDPMLANDDRLAYSATSSDVDADVSSVLGDDGGHQPKHCEVYI